jgi:hypothetical protein
VRLLEEMHLKIWKGRDIDAFSLQLLVFCNAPFSLPKGRQLVVYLARMVLFFGLKQQR